MKACTRARRLRAHVPLSRVESLTSERSHDPQGTIDTLSNMGGNHLGNMAGLLGGGRRSNAKSASMPNIRNQAGAASLGSAKRSVLKGANAVEGRSSADAIAEEGLHVDDEYEGPLGDMRRNWEEFSSALNCYGAVTAARDSCAPSLTGAKGTRRGNSRECF